MPVWTWVVPASAIALLLLASLLTAGPLLAWLSAAVLIGAVIAAVHHAEVVAHRIGEPFGTLVLALAVTVIEAALILSVMVAGGAAAAELPRDTIYAAVMIICNGVIGLCILVGGLAHREQQFRSEGAGAGLAALMVMSALTLVLPVVTVSTSSGTYSQPQLWFLAVTSAALWAIFVFVQTVRHRDYFMPAVNAANPDAHAEPPTVKLAWASFGLLLVSLVGVVGLAKLRRRRSSRRSMMPVHRAPWWALPSPCWCCCPRPGRRCVQRANRLQTSMNLAIGSAVASIGLTVPVVVVAAVVFDLHLVLGLGATNLVLLGLTFLVSSVTLASGRTHMMQGAVHLVLFAAFVFLAFVP